MCPFCISTTMMIAGSVTSSGGLAAVAISKFGRKKALPNPDLNPAQRSNEDVDHHD
jgi:hypothetical protein